MEHEHPHPTGPTFDTLKAAEALQQAGFTGVQAGAVTQTIVEAQDNLATKSDLRAIQAATKAEFKAIRTETKAEFKELRAEMKAEFTKLRAETQAEFAKLRAETQAEFAKLRAEMQALNKVVSTLEKVILGVTVPMVGVIFVAAVSLAVDYFFLN